MQAYPFEGGGAREAVRMFDSRTRMIDDDCAVEVGVKTNREAMEYTLLDTRSALGDPVGFSVAHASIRPGQGATREAPDLPCSRPRGRERLDIHKYHAAPDMRSGEARDPSLLRRDHGSERHGRGSLAPDRSIPMIGSLRRSIGRASASPGLPGDTRARAHSVVDGRA